MDEESRVFRALADPNRRVLLDLLLEGDRSVGDLGEHLAISQPAVSQHLQVLREAGLVTHRKAGRRNVYSVDAAPLLGVAGWLSKYEAFWDGKLDAFAGLLERRRN